MDLTFVCHYCESTVRLSPIPSDGRPAGMTDGQVIALVYGDPAVCATCSDQGAIVQLAPGSDDALMGRLAPAFDELVRRCEVRQRSAPWTREAIEESVGRRLDVARQRAV